MPAHPTPPWALEAGGGGARGEFPAGCGLPGGSSGVALLRPLASEISHLRFAGSASPPSRPPEGLKVYVKNVPKTVHAESASLPRALEQSVHRLRRERANPRAAGDFTSGKPCWGEALSRNPDG